jgi:hypothetical protein
MCAGRDDRDHARCRRLNCCRDAPTLANYGGGLNAPRCSVAPRKSTTIALAMNAEDDPTPLLLPAVKAP